MSEGANGARPGNRAGARARLIEIIKTRSFQSGREVKLTSGRTSTYYFNMKPTMLDAEGSHLIATLILDAIKGLDADLIGGLEMGGADRVRRCRSQPYGRTADQRILRAQAGEGARDEEPDRGAA
jgi:orotate phosphoribosyltransferase